MSKMKQWGIIYCPKEGSNHSHKRWIRIKKYFSAHHQDCLFFESKHRDDIEDICYHLCEDEVGVIVIVGGDAALNDAINGIMKSQKKHPSLGVIPNGFGNDFAKFWGYKPEKYIHTIDCLLKLRTRAVDVGICQLTNTYGKTHTRYFLDCINIGLAASITNIKRKTRSFFGNNTLSSLFSSFLLIFKRKSFKLSFSLPGENIQRRAMTACVGSSTGYGQTPSAVPYNGLLDVSIISDTKVMHIIQGLWLLLRGRFMAHKDLKVWRTKHIKFNAIGRAPVSLDGRVVYEPIKSIDITIQPEAIHFIIPE